MNGTTRQNGGAGESLRRSQVALDALRAALEELGARLDAPESELCDRALSRLGELRESLEAFAVQAHDAPGTPDRTTAHEEAGCELAELCHAAQLSLRAELRPRVLVAVEQSDARMVLDAESAVRGLRRLMRAMFACGAGAVLLHAHLEEDEAVFAVLDDQELFQPDGTQGARDYDSARQEIASLGGSTDEIGSADAQQGVIVRLPVRVLVPVQETRS